MRKSKDEAKNEENTTQELKVYEVGYLLTPLVKEEEVPFVYGNLKELILKLGGEIIADDVPKTINLAYTMPKVISNVRHKFNDAYFGWSKFFMYPEKVADLKKVLDLDPNFLRFLVIKTVKENTIASKKFPGRDSSRRRSSQSGKEEEVVIPINKEEIDKEIDALVQA